MGEASLRRRRSPPMAMDADARPTRGHSRMGAGPRGLCPGAEHRRRLGGGPARLRARPRRARRLGQCARGASPGSWRIATFALRRRAQSAGWRRPASPASSLRLGFHNHLVATGAAADNPADLLPTPKRGSYLPRVLGRDEVAALLDRIPARTPLEVRDRAMFELAYSCGLRAEEIVSVDLGDVDFDSEAVRVTGKGQKTRLVPIGEPAQRALRRYLEAARHTLGPAPEERALFVSRRGRRLALRRAAPPPEVGPGGRGGGPDLPAHPAPFLRDPPARGRRGSALDPGAARPFERLHDPDLHPCRALPAAPYAKSHPRA